MQTHTHRHTPQTHTHTHTHTHTPHTPHTPQTPSNSITCSTDVILKAVFVCQADGTSAPGRGLCTLSSKQRIIGGPSPSPHSLIRVMRCGTVTVLFIFRLYAFSSQECNQRNKTARKCMKLWSTAAAVLKTTNLFVKSFFFLTLKPC